MDSGGTHVGRAGFEIAEIVVDRERPAGDVAVAEIIGDADQGGQLRLMSRSRGGDVILVALEVHHRVGLGVGALPIGKDEVAGRCRKPAAGV